MWTCLYYRSIPVIPTNYDESEVKKYLPFFNLLQLLWSKAIFFQPYETPREFIEKLYAMSSVERVMRLDKVNNLLRDEIL